jgi:hypothetical protein
LDHARLPRRHPRDERHRRFGRAHLRDLCDRVRADARVSVRRVELDDDRTPPARRIGPADTFVRGISGDTLVGYSIESFVARGFQYRSGGFSDIIIAGAAGTYPDDLDDGRIVGMYEDLVTSHGFVIDGNVARTVDHPLGTSLGTELTGVDGDRIVGNYLSLLDASNHGFLYDGRTFEPIDVPGAIDTTVNGIDGERIVGTYRDALENRHGFVAVVPEPATAGVLLMCLGWAGSRHRRRRSVV